MSTPVLEQPAPTAAYAAQPDDPLLECLAIITRLHGRPVTPRALAADLPLDDGRLTPALFIRAADRHGYSARLIKRPLKRLSSLLLPAVVLLADGSACVLTTLDAKRLNAEVVTPESGFGARSLPLAELAQNYSGYCLFVQPRPRPDARIDPMSAFQNGSWFWGTLWRYRRYYLEAGLSTALVNVLTVATAFFTMNVYDRVVPNNAVETLLVLATGTLLAVVFEFLARNLRSYFLDFAGKKADIVLAGRVFAHALGLRMEVTPSSPGAFSAQLRELDSLRDFITSATLTTLADLPFVVFFVWIIALIGGPLCWPPLIAVAVILLVGLVAQIPLRRVMQAHVRESVLKNGMLVEAIDGAETLRTLSAQGGMQRRWEEYTALTGESAARSRFLSGLVVNISLGVQQCTTVGLIVWGVYLIRDGVLTTGALIAVVMLAGRALGPLGQVAALMARYQHARASYAQLRDLMQRPLERPVERRYVHRETLDGAYTFNAVQFAYPGSKLPVLQDFSLSIGAGEHIGILGRIGSGKSTLLKLAVGLYRPTAGAILVDGVDMEQIDPNDLRHHIGYVGQDTRLFQGTLRDNVTLGAPLADDQALLAAARMAGLDRLVEQHPLGFDLPIPEGGGGLSGGQRQAVALARALIRAPRILLLDEPTSAMDSATEQALLIALKRYAEGRTLVLVTHKPSMLSLVDRIAVIDQGRVALDGPREQVLRQLSRPAAAAGP